MPQALPISWRTLFSWVLPLLLLAQATPAAAQAPTWQAARVFNPVLPASALGFPPRISATATDAAGNLYVAGSFTDAVVLGTTTLTSAGSNDAFVAKLAPGGTQVIWAYRAGGQGYDDVDAVLVSGTAVYIAGTFSAPAASFGSLALTGAANQNAYAAKLTDAGPTASFVWAQRVGGADDMYVQAAALSGTSLYLGGSFKGVTGDFGPLSLANTSQPSYLFDGYVVKLTDTGPTANPVWVRGVGGTGSEAITALAASGPNVYATGGTDGPAAIVGTTTLPSAGSEDTFVTKLLDAGPTASFAWVQGLGGTGYDIASAVAVSGASVYIAGTFDSSSLGLGSSIRLTNAGINDAFVAKLTDAGAAASFAWAQRAGGTGNDGATAVAISGASVYVAGGYSGTANFGSTALASAGSIDAFVAKLNDAGATAAFAWVQRAGGTGEDVAGPVALSGTSLYATGYLKSASAAFGSTTLTNAYAPDRLSFAASLTDVTLSAPAARPADAAVIFPNPAHLTATVRLPPAYPGGSLTLANMLGSVVRRYAVPAAGRPEITLDLRGLPAGLYVLQGPGGSQRLVVE